jgi:hypothetical protein
MKNTHEKVSLTDVLNPNTTVVDRHREWFQYQYEPFEFGDDLEDWWIVKTKCIDHTNKLNLDEDFRLVEFVHYTPQNILGLDDWDYHDYDDWDVEIGVEKVWNSLPFENYQSPYEVMVMEKPLSLKCGRPYELEEYKDVIENPYKVINHSTTHSLELMTKELSEWKMECLWEGDKPLFSVEMD